MDLVQLNSDIQHNSLGNLYIFTGDEIGLQNIYINQILKLKPGRRVDKYSEIKNKVLSRNTLFSSQGTQCVYIIRDDYEFFKAEKEWEQLDKMVTGVTLILLVTHLDKKTKFYHHFKDTIVEFHKMTQDQLYLNISPLVKGQKDAILYFIESCNNDYSTILNNLDKFNRLGYTEMTYSISDLIAPREEAGDVFKLVDYLISLDHEKCIHEVEKLLSSGSNELGILSMIGTRIHQTILIEGYRNSRTIDKDTGISKWICNNILKLNRIEPCSLLTALRVVNDCEQGIKLGYMEPGDAVLTCIITILSL